MKILHNNRTAGHNMDSEYEGGYRILDFDETVKDEEIQRFRDVAKEAILMVHSQRHVRKIKGACKSKRRVAEVDLSHSSFDAMFTSVVLSIIAAKTGGFAVCRPPGHHASFEKAEGFCFFNNIAIATSYLLKQKKRIAIIDIDGHHGNGTQEIFKKEADVFFGSIHQTGVYPHTGSHGDTKKGAQHVVNIPLLKHSGDDLLLKSLTFILKQVEKFNPDYIGISAGFDGYFKDRMLGLNYSKVGYYEAGKLISGLKKPMFAVLEGGYHESVKKCVDSLVAGINQSSLIIPDEVLSISPEDCHENLNLILRNIKLYN